MSGGLPTIPERHYFKIGEVSEIVGVKPFVLRYWETEFPLLAPEKSKTHQRVYSRDDVLLISLIRFLLHDRRYTIAGARTILEAAKGDWIAAFESHTGFGGEPAASPDTAAIEEIEARLKEIEALSRRKDLEIADLKSRYLRVTRELLGEKTKNRHLYSTLYGGLTEIRDALGDEETDITTGPRFSD